METTKATTNCPTCGSEVDVHNEGTTHYFIPKKTYTEDEADALLFKLNDQINITSGGLSLSNESLSVWFNKHKKK